MHVVFNFVHYDLDIDKSYNVSNTFPSCDDVQDKLPVQLQLPQVDRKGLLSLKSIHIHLSSCDTNDNSIDDSKHRLYIGSME